MQSQIEYKNNKLIHPYHEAHADTNPSLFPVSAPIGQSTNY